MDKPPSRARQIAANIKEVADLPTRRQWIEALVTSVILMIAFMLLYFLKDESLDRQILLALNPDHYIPVVDEVVVAVTKFSMATVGTLGISWEVGFLLSEYRPEYTPLAPKYYNRVGLVLGTVICSLALWGILEYWSVFLMWGAVMGFGFWFMGQTFKWDVERRRRLNRFFWVTVLAAIVTAIIGEAIIKNIIQRPRPLASVNDDWNGAIRLVPDAVTRKGYSYVSGHSSALFAMLTPLFWAARRWWSKGIIFSFAAFHAFTRVYLGAHFPFCAFMGSLFGFLIATAFVFIFNRQGLKAK